MTLRSGRLPFQVEVVDAASMVTAHAGLPLVIEGFRALGLARAVREHVHFKQRLRGYPEAACVETLVALLAAGGECVDDVRILRADGGLMRLWGRCAMPAAETLRAFLNRFHDAAMERERVAHTAYVPAESAGLQGLRAVQQALLRTLEQQSSARRSPTRRWTWTRR